mgnify:CR=1 FL=1
MCYGLGILETFGNLYNIKRIRLSIYQPRRENVDTWEISTEDLLKWADEVLKPAAKLAYAGEGDFKAGEHCIFCRIKDTCRERADYYMELMKHELEDPAELNNAASKCRLSEQSNRNPDAGIHFIPYIGIYLLILLYYWFITSFHLIEPLSNLSFTPSAPCISAYSRPCHTCVPS